MRVGISIASAYSVSDVRDGARQMIDRAAAAARAGLDSLFVGDHHVTPNPYYQNTPILGRILAEWDDRDAGALFLLPLWNPVLAAEQISTLACITQGRFIMQCGLGRDDYQFNAMGADIRFRPSAFEQSLDALRRLWRGEEVSLDGRWKFDKAKISPLPPVPVEVWIGASAPAAIDRAARLGDAWLADPSMTIDEAAKALNMYRQALASHDRPEPETIPIRRDVYVAGSPAEASAALDAVRERGYRGFDPEALVIGTADEVAEHFSAFEKLGYTDIITRNLHSDPAEAVASTERLGEVKSALQ